MRRAFIGAALGGYTGTLVGVMVMARAGLEPGFLVTVTAVATVAGAACSVLVGWP